jgi:predicted phosphodiesterase
MRIALLADLHGNLAALNAVLDDLARDGGADTILALGDLAMLGPQPAEVIDRLRQVGAIAIQGNTDAWYQHDLPGDYQTRDEREAFVIRYARWARPLLGEERVAYLLGLPFQYQADLGGGESLLAVHGSPRRIDEPIYPETTSEALDEMLAGVSASLLAFGHTHRAMETRHRGITLVNPGSLGNPIPPDPDPRAAYGVVSADGRLDVSLRRVSYDPAPAMAAARERAMPGAAGWIAKFAAAWPPQGSGLSVRTA